MNLEHVWLFAGEAYYSPSMLSWLEPLTQHAGFDLEQFVTALRNAGKNIPDNPIMTVGQDGIAQVHIDGALMPTKSPIMMAFGGTATKDIANAFDQIAHNPKIKGTLVHHNSGGGSASMIDSTAQMIHEVNKTKPVVSQVHGISGSADYYLASQATKVFASNRQSMIGSIGTQLVINDSSEAAKKAGIRRIVIDTGVNKSIGVPGTPVTTDQVAHLQETVNHLNGMFLESVQRNRPLMNIENVSDGSVWLAQQALDRNLIDGIQSSARSMNTLRQLIKFRNK